MARLSLSLLGPFQATLDREPITGFEANKVRALLAYLAVEAHLQPQAHPRRTLAGLLWPDKPESAALANLRNALSNLRKAISDRSAADDRSAVGDCDAAPFLLTTRETIQFNLASDHRLDVAAFQALMEGYPDHQQLQQAVDLYRGEFLQGFSVRDSPEFEAWIRLTREHLHAQMLAALDALAAHHEARGAHPETIACAQRQVALEPWHEGAHRRWMRALAASGQRAMALNQYATCRKLLADELGIEPEPATTALYRQILDGARVAVQPAPPGAPVQAPPARAEPSSGQGATGQETDSALPVDAALDGEQRMVSVVQAVLCGSEARLARAGSKAGTAILDQVRDALAAEALRFGGQVDRRGPDELIACFGAARAHEDDPERALLAALAMQAEFDARMAEWVQAHTNGGQPRELELRVAVYTGRQVIAAAQEPGPGGAVMQKTLECAAHLQATAKPGQVWVDGTTRRLVEPLFEWDSQGEVCAQQGGQAVRVYRALGRRASPIKMRGIAGLSAPLIGRDAELHAVRQAVERLQNGVGGIVTVVGEAGIGKSRLVAQARRLAAGSQPLPAHSTSLHWVEGRCLSYATHVPYQVCIDALHGLLGLNLGTSSENAAHTLREQVRALCPAQVDDVYPFLARMMSLPLDGSAEARLRGIQGEGLQVLTFQAVEKLLARAARQAPLAIICEDLHWADVTSVDLLIRLLALTDRAPILWICVFRPETEHGCWRIKETCARRYAHRHTDLWLHRLSDSESAQLIGSLLDIEDLPDALRARMLERAEGNPFYVEEILRSLIDDEMIVHDPHSGRWRTARQTSSQVLPDTLRGVLVSRMDRLPRGTRQVMQLASVVGRTFSLRLLHAISSPQPKHRAADESRQKREGPGERGPLDAHLVALQHAQMIREQSRVPEATYAFRHQLTLEAAYDSLPPRKRRVLHRRVAEALERLYPEHVEDMLGLLAHHWEHADQVKRAVSVLRQAGERAAAQFANAEAAAYLSRALRLVPETDRATRYALLLAREQVYNVQGARAAQQRDLAALQEAAGTSRQRAEVAWRQARCAEMTSDHKAAIAAAQKAVLLAQVAQDVESEAWARLYWSQALTYLEQRDAARRQCEQALPLVQAERLRPLKATILHWLGRIAMYGLDHEESKVYYGQALDILQQIGDRRRQGMVLVSLCSTYRRLEDYAQCRVYGERALRFLRETGERTEEGWALLELGKACYTPGDYSAAQAYWAQALPVLQETGTRGGEAWAREHLGWIARDTGDDAAARRYLEQVLPLFREIGEYRSEGRVLAWLGMHAHRLGESRVGLDYLQQALSLGERTHNLHLQALAHTFEGSILSDLGQIPQAVAAFERALDLRHGLNAPSMAGYALAGLAEICLAQGNEAQALAYVDDLLDTVGSLSVFAVNWEPFSVYLTCYRVLRANRDRRAAEVLAFAYPLLAARAATFDREGLRRAYLENVPAHREIVALWKNAGANE